LRKPKEEWERPKTVERKGRSSEDGEGKITQVGGKVCRKRAKAKKERIKKLLIATSTNHPAEKRRHRSSENHAAPKGLPRERKSAKEKKRIGV